MLILDKRAGSIELLPHLQKYDIPVEVDILSSADISFLGNGPGGETVRVGVEHKKLNDIVNCMETRRLSGFQLDNLLVEYDFAYIMVQGQWRPGEGGVLEELKFRKGKAEWCAVSSGTRVVLYRAFQSFLHTLQVKAGTPSGNQLVVSRVVDGKESAALLVAWWHWWNDKQWDQHTSHEGVYAKTYQSRGEEGHKPRNFIRRPLSQLEIYLQGVDGIGGETAKEIAKSFRSVEELVHMSPGTIANCKIEQFIKGGGKRTVRLGEKKAEKIYKSLRS